MSASLRLRANAKLNLFLRVGGAGDDGWHSLETVFHSVGFADVIELVPAPPGEIEVDMAAPPVFQAYLPEAADNLVTVAARRLLERAGQPLGARINVTKRIPVGSGLAGGSADAAATLIGLNRLWGLGVGDARLHELAVELGSDVAFSLSGGTALGTGRGNELATLLQPGPLWFVLGLSDRPLLTEEVYREWDVDGRPGPRSAAMVDALTTGDVIAVAHNLHNDLEGPALRLRPEIGRGLDAMRAAGALGAGMTGSGPTVFGLCEGEDHANEVAQRVADEFSQVEVASSAGAGVEPQA